MDKQIAKAYDHKAVEDKIYKFWLDGGYFRTKADKSKKPYSIVMPPPNVTGKLHMGHALDQTLQDILIRFKRMQGYNTLWVPGVDHAAIATEAKVVAKLKEEGLSKEQLGREGFLKKAFEWKENYGNIITDQIKKLGASCDWSRERFTMDQMCTKAVNEVFVRLYEKGLLYKGERIINWCTKCKTSISDAEVDFNEKAGHFWYIKYPLENSEDYIEIATTRPETLLGDTAIAVNPTDQRYRHLIGKTAILPLMGRSITIVGDDYVEPDFGTGAVKITPAHDPNDFEVGLRHKLPIICVMNEDGTMNENAGVYKGLDRYEARKRIVKDLKALGLIAKVEDIHHNVGTCYRCGETIEPMVSEQWFVKMHDLAQPAIKCVQEGEVRFIPSRFEKIYFNWLYNIKDWCISRQLWWGHRIPAYYCAECGNTMVSGEEVTSCSKCHSTEISQDENTLDTWFSAALWPFSVFGWPDDTEDLEQFYPTDTLVTGYDIIFFWVVRMIFSGLEHTGQIPFKNVLIHGLVRDAQGRKMSKSLGNGIDPIEIIEEYGADALRFTLATGNSPGNDLRFSEEKLMASRNFANKIFNAARFIHMKADSFSVNPDLPENLQIEDKWILSKLNKVTQEVTGNIDKFELGLAAQKIYDFIWDDFCDWYIELAKIRLAQDKQSKVADATRSMLIFVLQQILKLLHPFMPFITEEIWQTFPHTTALIIAKYPEHEQKFADFAEESEKFEMIIKAIKAIRNKRAEMNAPMSKKIKMYIETEHPEIFASTSIFIERLSNSSPIELVQSGARLPDDVITIVTTDAKVFIPSAELLDKEEERTKLQKAYGHVQKEYDLAESKLANANFLNKAPSSVVEKVKQTRDDMKKKLENLSMEIDKLK
ncbi:MAG: valine--tRNA ligase [Clostridia bacterium]|nr:valine--tRNA ligase [Clostridia bacterium]